MTKEQKIEAIRKKCIEVNPEIVELKFGCEVFLQSFRERENKATVIKNTDGFLNFLSHEFVDVFRAYPLVKAPINDIIGRPIRLADVLLAMGDEGGVDITNAGMFINHNAPGDNEAMTGIFWNLRSDDLSLQSDDCISFIYELVK